MTSNSLRAAAFRRRPESNVSSAKSYVLKFYRQVVNAPCRRRDPVRKFSGFDHLPHQRTDKRMIAFRWEPCGRLACPILFRQKTTIGTDVVTGEASDLTM